MLTTMADTTRDTARKAFGAALADALAIRGVYQADLADTLGTTQGTISGWVTGKSEPETPEKAFAVERALDLQPGTLSRHLGYVPPDLDAVMTVEAAVLHDSLLDDQNKRGILALYKELTRRTRR